MALIQGGGGVSAASTVAVTLTGVVAGHNLRVVVENDSGLSTTSISDGTNTFFLVDALTGGGGAAQSAYWPNSLSGSVTVTATLSGTPSFARIWVEEWSGDATTSPLDGHSAAFTATTGAGQTAAAGSFTPAVSGDNIWCGIVQANSQTVTLGSGFSAGSVNLNGQGFWSEFQTQSPAAPINPSWTIGGAANNFVFAMAFKAPQAAFTLMPQICL